jgi:hypothetical protein
VWRTTLPRQEHTAGIIAESLPRHAINRKLRLGTWNAHSIQHKITDVDDFMHRDKLDILAVNETWLSDATSTNRIQIKGYDVAFRRDRPRNHALVNYGGVCVYVRRGMMCERLNHLEHDDQEVVWLKVNGAKRDIVVCCAYRAPNRSRPEFLDYIEDCINTIGATKEVIIMGDCNINFAAQRDSATCRTLLNLYGYEQIITGGTHYFNHTQSSTIDIICVNRPTKVVSCGILEYDPGHIEYHRPVFVEYLIDQAPLKVMQRTTRDFSERNIQFFLSELELIQWDWDGTTASDATDLMNTTLDNLFGRCFPLKTFVITDKSLSNFTPAIREAKAEKYRLLVIKRRTGEEADRVAFNRQCDRLRWLCREQKREAFEQQLALNFGDSRKIWKTLNHFLPIGNKSESKSITLTVDQREVSDAAEVAEEFNNYFSTVGEQLANAIPMTEGDPLDYVDHPVNGGTFSLYPVSAADIIDEVKNMSPYKSVADAIPLRILKRAIMFLVVPIVNIINLSFQSGEVPIALKKAVVTCIFKDGHRNVVSNYRPISVLCFVGKIIESIVQQRLTAFLNAKNMFYSFQSAFRENHSCEMALNELLAKIYYQLEQKQEAVVVFLDLKKAFDTIDRTILFRKMERYGVRGHSLNWFKSLLSGRTQGVKIEEHTSQSREVHVGIPQGSGLGPLLFSIYVNDIHKACNIPETMLFADDTALLFTGDISEETINNSLDRFYKWLKLNKLTLNCTKTKYMLFSKRQHPSLPALLMNGIELEKVSSIKYLGVIIDDKLSFNEHINSVCNKLGRFHSILYNNKSFISRKTAESLVTALAIPRLMYAASVFHRTSERNLKSLDVLYKKLIRIVYRLPYDTPTAEIFLNTKFLPLCLLRQIQSAQLAFRSLSGNCATYLRNRITLLGDDRRRRPERGVATPVERYHVPFMRLELSRQSYLYWCPVLLNNIPHDIISQALNVRHSVTAFTRRYKLYIKNLFIGLQWSRNAEMSRDYLAA